jgi:hypothetical protein
MGQKEKSSSLFKNLREDNLASVSGGFIGVDPNVEKKYYAVVKKAKTAYKDGDKIPGALSEDDWDSLNTFYGQVNKSGQPWYDEFEDMMSNQASGVEYEDYKGI